MINVTNGKVIRLLVDDEPFDVRYGELSSHERLLDFRTGVLHRRVEWSSPADRTVRVTSARLVSLVQRSVAAIEYQVEAVDQPVRLVISPNWSPTNPCPRPATTRGWRRCWKHPCDRRNTRVTVPGQSWCTAPSTVDC